MSDDCRQTLRKLPVVPGQLFGPEAGRALERRRQSNQASETWGPQSRSMGPSAQCPGKRGAQDPCPKGTTSAPPKPLYNPRGTLEAHSEAGSGQVFTATPGLLSQGYRLQFRRRPPPPTDPSDHVQIKSKAQSHISPLNKNKCFECP